jgi:hypothetical protein
MTGMRFILIGCVAWAHAAFAEFPERPIRLVVPQAAGSATDNIARLVAPELSKILGHALGPQVPQMHGAWDSMPGSTMTNSNITAIAKAGSGSELTLKNKDGEQKILVNSATEYYNFVPGTRADLKRGETIFTGARLDGDKLLAQRVSVSKDGVKPPQ